MRVVGIAVVAVVASYSTSPAQELRNAGFESVSKDSASVVGWIVRAKPGFTVAIDSSISHGGRASLRVRGLSDGEAGAVQLLPADSLCGRTVEASFFMRSEAVSAATESAVALVAVGQRGPIAVDSLAPALAGVSDWRLHQLRLAVPTAARTVGIVLGSKSRGSYWFDDVSLRAVDGVATPCDVAKPGA